MQTLASFVMRGRSQAVMIATVLAMLSLLMPPISILSSAVVTLVTLRKGPNEGLLLLILAAAACGILAQISLGQMVPVVGFVLLMWLPVWFLAWLLRSGRSLALALQGALVLGLLLIGGQFLQDQDPIGTWTELLGPFIQSLVDSQLIEQAQQQNLLETMAHWMPGMVATGFFLQSLLALFLARWWQATLYNPGGFRAEFHQLRMHRAVAILTLGVLLLRLLGVGGVFWDYAAMLLLAAWFIQGLALAHGVRYLLGAKSGWLIGLYLLLLFAMPHTMMALAAAGFADGWLNFRARLQAGNPPERTG
jgi:hypothetical protein